MRFYDYRRSSSAWRVRIGLGLKGLQPDVVTVDVSREVQQQAAEGYGEVNPQRQVPVLEWDDGDRVVRLTQSMAILEYLDERHPEPPLLPADPVERAYCRQCAEIVNAGIQPLQNNYVLATVVEHGGDEQAWARHFVGRGLTALEKVVSPRAGRFLSGDQPSLADIYLVPQLFNARRFGLDVDAWPTLVRVDAECAQLPAFAAAHPDALDA